MAGEFDDIRARLEAIAEELTDLAIDPVCASRSTPAATSCRSTNVA